ncbi:MAG: hypothetical protein QOI78_547 [Actinomycetota bacterium]|nr:hypothetical protein [Actinomycetota bacterium]
MAAPVCPCCGSVLDPDGQAWDYILPDSLSELSPRKLKKVLRFDSGVFLGVWLGLDGEDANRVNSAARDGGDAWIGFSYTGLLLNEVRPWSGTRGLRVTATASEDWTAARVTDSEDHRIKQILTRTWPHAEYLRVRRSGR